MLDSNNSTGSTENHTAFLEEIRTAGEREAEESGWEGQGVLMPLGWWLGLLGKSLGHLSSN